MSVMIRVLRLLNIDRENSLITLRPGTRDTVMLVTDLGTMVMSSGPSCVMFSWPMLMVTRDENNVRLVWDSVR